MLLTEIEDLELEITDAWVLEVAVSEGLVDVQYQCFLTLVLWRLVR